MSIDPRHVVKLQGRDYITVVGAVDHAHQSGLLAIETDLIQIPDAENGHCAIVKATATFKGEGGPTVWSAHADAAPNNTKGPIQTALIRMAECVPLRAQILTRQGWKTHDALRGGELVLAYDRETDRNVWTPLLDVSVFEAPQPTVTMESRSFRAICTPGHTWAAIQYRGSGIHRRMTRVLVKTHELRQCDRIIVAARAGDGTHPLSPRHAAILGWLASDGWISRTEVKGVVYYRAVIAQSKPHRIEELRALLGSDASEQWALPYDRTFPNGRTYACRAACKFELKAVLVRALIDQVWGRPLPAEPWRQLQPMICQLSSAARQSFLNAMLAGDGFVGSVSATRCYAQKAKDGVMEALETLATLEGIALGRPRMGSGGLLPTRSLRQNRLVGVSYLKLVGGDQQPVWCPTTSYGTWVMNLDGFITITGNTRAVGRVLRFACNIPMVALEELADDAVSDGPSAPRTTPQVRHEPPGPQKAPQRPTPAPTRPDGGQGERVAAARVAGAESPNVFVCARKHALPISRFQREETLRQFGKPLCREHADELKAHLEQQQSAAEPAAEPVYRCGWQECGKVLERGWAEASLAAHGHILCVDHLKEGLAWNQAKQLKEAAGVQLIEIEPGADEGSIPTIQAA